MLDRLLAEWPLKLLALAIAFALWVSITGEDRAVKDLDLPLEVELREDHILAGLPPTTVTVRVGGPETLIRRLEPVGLAVKLDLRDAAQGERDVQLTEEYLSGLPKRVAVNFFEPDRVSLVIDEKMRRELSVVADFLGEPPQGYSFYRARVRPETVVVEGPKTEVEGLTQLRTDPIRLDHRTRTFIESVNAVPDRPEVRIVDPQPLEVRVVVDAAPVELAFDDVPVVLTGQLHEASITPSTLRVTLTGPPALLERIGPAQIRAVADVTELEPGRQTHRIAVEAGVVDLPEEQLWRVGVKSVSPGKVAVRLTERSAAG